MAARPLEERAAEGAALKILWVRFAALGDCVMSAWTCTALRRAMPEAQIHWAVEDRCAEVIDQTALATEKWIFPRRKWKGARWSPATWRDQIRHYSRLRPLGFDAGFDMHGHGKTALCLYLAKPRFRLAARATDALSARLNPLYGRKPPHVHFVEWDREVVSSWRPLELPERPLMPPIADLPRSEAPRVALNLSAGMERNVVPWPTWRPVAEDLLARGREVVLLGVGEPPADVPPGCQNLVGQTTVREASAQIAAADVLATADTGAAHLAAAYGTPVVTLFGKNRPEEFRPYTPRGVAIPSPGVDASGHRVEVVLESIERLLEARVG